MRRFHLVSHVVSLNECYLGSRNLRSVHLRVPMLFRDVCEESPDVSGCTSIRVKRGGGGIIEYTRVYQECVSVLRPNFQRLMLILIDECYLCIN